MFKKKILVLCILNIIHPAALAGMMRHDIDRQDYYDYGLNLGKYGAGKKNVAIYDSQGGYRGTLNVIPDFSPLVSNGTGGGATLIFPNVVATAAHVENITDSDLGRRFQRQDPTLFNGAQDPSSYDWLGVTNKSAHRIELSGSDYMLVRQRYIDTEAAPAELFTDESQLTPGLDIARSGQGMVIIANRDGSLSKPLSGPWSKVTSGGTNTIVDMWNQTNRDGNTYYEFYYTMPRQQKTALDTIGLSGDSGSGAYGWDKVAQRWKYIGAVSRGVTEGYDHGDEILVGANRWTQQQLDELNDAPLNTRLATNVIILGAQDRDSGAGDIHINGDTQRYHGLRSDIPQDALSDDDFAGNKNLIFGGAGGELRLDAPGVNLGAATLTFQADYLLTDGGDATRRLNSAGYIIEKDSILTSRLTGSRGDIWSKIGQGTLVIEGSGDNDVDLNVGDGVTRLNRSGGHAAQNIRIGSGRATVQLTGDGQLDGTRVGFGVRGGTLDLYGHSLSWSDIYHLDKGATLSSTRAGTTADFTFTGAGEKTFLGRFTDGGSLSQGLLHITYAPTQNDPVWRLKGDIDARGGMTIKAGEVAVQAPLVLHGNHYVDPIEYQKTTFNVGDVDIQRGATFSLHRNAEADGQFMVNDGATLRVSSDGALANSQQGIDEGARLNGTVTLQGKDSLLVFNPARDFTVYNQAAVSGDGALLKQGAGTLHTSGDLSGLKTALIEEGLVAPTSVAALGHPTAGWHIADRGLLQVNVREFDAATRVIDPRSDGTLLLTDRLLTPTDEQMTRIPSLYLGTSSRVFLSQLAGRDWNLGGGGGLTYIRGELPGQGAHTINIGNGHNSGRVQFSSDSPDFHGTINVRPGMMLSSSKDEAVGSGSVAVNYGGYVSLASGLRNITAASAGVVSADTLNNDDTPLDLSQFDALAIGGSGQDSTLTRDITATRSGYHFSSLGGNLTVASDLTGQHNLTIDGQGATTGTVTLSGNNTFSGDILIQGVRGTPATESLTQTTLKLGSDQALGDNNTLTLRQGGALDLNGYSAHVRLNSAETGTRIFSANNDPLRPSILNFAPAGETLALNSMISGDNIRLNRYGSGSVTVNGNNDFSGATTLYSGITHVGHQNAFGQAGNEVWVNGGQLALDGIKLNAPIILSGGDATHPALMDDAEWAKVGALRLASDAWAQFSQNVQFDKIQLFDKRLTVAGGYINLADTLIDDGSLAFIGSRVNINERSLILRQGRGDITLAQDSVLYINTVQQSAMAQRSLTLAGGEIHLAESTITSPLQINGSGTLQSFSDNRLDGDISGEGRLKLINNQYSSLTLSGNSSAFRGDWVLGGGTHLQLAPAADNLLAANLMQDGDNVLITKQGNKTLTLSGDNHGYSGTLQVDAGQLRLQNAQALTGGNIHLAGGSLVMDMADSGVFRQTITGAADAPLIKQGSGSLRLAGDNRYTGATRVQAGMLSVNGLASREVSVERGAVLDASGELAGNLDNAGTVSVGLAGVGDTLRVKGDYRANQGRLLLNTLLEGDDSVTDRLLIDGDSAGQTRVQVTNFDGKGKGADTVQGIELIRVAGKADGQFVQEGRIAAGAYDYTLANRQGRWYLTSFTQPQPPKPDEGNGDDDNNTGGDNNKGDDNNTGVSKRQYRPEFGAWSAMLAQANSLFMLSTREIDRVRNYTDAVTGLPQSTSLWLRNSPVVRTRFSDAGDTLYTRQRSNSTQLGGSLLAADNWRIGLLVGQGRSNSKTRSSLTGRSAKGHLSGYSAGLYADWSQDDASARGAYVGALAQYSWFRAQVSGEGQASEHYHLKGVTTGLETGYGIGLWQRDTLALSLTPHARWTMMGVRQPTVRDASGVRIAASSNLRHGGDIGLRLDASAPQANVFVDISGQMLSDRFGVQIDGVGRDIPGAKLSLRGTVGISATLLPGLSVDTTVDHRTGKDAWRETRFNLGVNYRF